MSNASSASMNVVRPRHLNHAALGPGMCRLAGVAFRSSLGKMGSAEGFCQVAEPPESCLSWLVESTQKSEG